MPEENTRKRAQQAKRAGKSSSTQAGEFVREEMHHIRDGKHGARSAKQAIAIGLSKARRAGVDLKAPKKGEASEETRTKAKQDRQRGQEDAAESKKSTKRAKASTAALKREGTAAASHKALSQQGHAAAKERSAKDRSEAAQKAVRTKGHEGLVKAARKAARTRASKS